MCCFSGKVDYVAKTRIFARQDNAGRQYLAYSMNYQATEPVAMILPLPVKSGTADEAAVQFISLQDYTHFFRDIAAGFAQTGAPGGGAGGLSLGTRAPLPVVTVGDFIASYVTRVADFDRLDSRFVIPRRTWNRLPQYRDYGFAVFKLKAAPRGSTVHPMALSFATRFSKGLFFPTVHIHDGRVHPREEFDHDLYLQFADEVPHLPYAIEASGRADSFLNVKRTKGLVDGKRPFYRMELRGVLPNRDTYIPSR